jgi:very-short-patch-repair endonuclease
MTHSCGELHRIDHVPPRPLVPFIVDFYAPDLRLAIEVDGMSHDEPGAYEDDADRQRRLEALGVHILRFRNDDVLRTWTTS